MYVNGLSLWYSHYPVAIEVVFVAVVDRGFQKKEGGRGKMGRAQDQLIFYFKPKPNKIICLSNHCIPYLAVHSEQICATYASFGDGGSHIYIESEC